MRWRQHYAAAAAVHLRQCHEVRGCATDSRAPSSAAPQSARSDGSDTDSSSSSSSEKDENHVTQKKNDTPGTGAAASDREQGKCNIQKKSDTPGTGVAASDREQGKRNVKSEPSSSDSSTSSVSEKGQTTHQSESELPKDEKKVDVPKETEQVPGGVLEAPPRKPTVDEQMPMGILEPPPPRKKAKTVAESLWIIAGDDALVPSFNQTLKERSGELGWSFECVRLPSNLVLHTGVAIAQVRTRLKVVKLGPKRNP